jgi:Protein of unknown function DUF262
MTKKWQSSLHPIADIRDWNESGTLLLQPDYQRREVWGNAARVMLIDSVLNEIPMPKIFVSKFIKDKRTYRSVIDGQQRISTILSYLEDGFQLSNPYVGPYEGMKFSDLPHEVQSDILLYGIDFNEASGLSSEELREVYSRVNKYLVPLNRQELRKADFPGDFLNVAEELANLDSLDDFGIFNATSRRRSLDVEYVSELLSAQIRGISDKKDAIEECYRDYRKWSIEEVNAAKLEFTSVIADISKIFDASYPIKKTRWKQKADFYSFYLATLYLKRSGFSLADDLAPLRKDLAFLDSRIAPTSEIPILSKYAIYCVSQANSASSRNWRSQFIQAILRGSYSQSLDDPTQRKFLSSLATDIRYSVDPNFNGDGCPPAEGFICGICGTGDEGETSLRNSVLYWPKGTNVFQLTNSHWAHAKCKANLSAEALIEGTEMDGTLIDDDEDEDDAS